MIEITPETIGLIVAVISALLGYFARRPELIQAKKKITLGKSIITEIDNALYDDKITEEEFRKIFDSLKLAYDSQ